MAKSRAPKWQSSRGPSFWYLFQSKLYKQYSLQFNEQQQMPPDCSIQKGITSEPNPVLAHYLSTFNQSQEIARTVTDWCVD